jgi:hypothetical protein
MGKIIVSAPSQGWNPGPDCAVQFGRLVGLFDYPAVVDQLDHPAAWSPVDLVMDRIVSHFDRQDLSDQFLDPLGQDRGTVPGSGVGPGGKHLDLALTFQSLKAPSEGCPVPGRHQNLAVVLERLFQANNELGSKVDVPRQQDDRIPAPAHSLLLY